MSRGLRAALLAGAAVFVAMAPTAAGAADAVDAGWWWKAQSGQLVPLPPPPGVPEGGLVVQSAVDGATAIAAVRYQMGDDETAPVLRLRLAESGNEAAEAAIVLACPTTTPWESGSAQPWEEKPQPDCSRQAVGALAEDGTTMSFDLSAVAPASLVDVVLVPGTVEGLPEGINGASFTLVFEAPTDDDLVTQQAGPSPPPSDSVSGLSPNPPPSSGSAVPFVPRSTQAPSLPPPVNPVAPALPADEVAAPPRSAPPSGAAPSFAPVSAPDASDARTLAVVLLIAAAAGTVLVGQRDQVLRLVGRTSAVAAATPVAGLGRFARERPGPPPSLR